MVLHLQNEDKLLEMTKENANWKTVNIQGIKNESDFPDIKRSVIAQCYRQKSQTNPEDMN